MSKLRLYGSTSGYNELTVPAVADNSEINLGGFAGNTYVQSAIASAGVPSGTKQLFVQTAAPTGWTKDTTHNNKALRVVSGTAGSGGSDAFTTTFGSSKTTESHTLTIAEMPSHAHENEIYNTNNGGGLAIETIGRANAAYIRDATVMENEGGGGAHSHNLSDFDLQYVDVIIATKD